MESFTFYQDNKLTIWERHTFEIEAETKEEAIEKVIKEAQEQKKYMSDPIFGGSTEKLYDTEEYMLPEDNSNYPTTEIYDNETNEAIFDNLNEVLNKED